MIQCKIDLSELAKIQEIPKRILTKEFFDELGSYMVSSTQRKIKSGISPENAPLTRAWKKSGLTLMDTGRLMSSISHKAEETKVTVGTNVIYGRIQQLGGTIKPKKATKLWVPAGWNTRKLMRKYGGSPSSVVKAMKQAGYKIWKASSGKAMLYAERKGKPQVLFVLKDEVTIPARRYLNIDTIDLNVIKGKFEKWLKKK
ncbi:MAG TPA: phage virion morphogenesis protein [Candidatus Hydrothermia bacterium]|nr:phage virion morphogenesis protein [Candidatus Hydrothermia bacterium]